MYNKKHKHRQNTSIVQTKEYENEFLERESFEVWELSSERSEREGKIDILKEWRSWNDRKCRRLMPRHVDAQYLIW